MNKKNLAGLVVLNAVLLVTLGVLCLTPRPASAQLGGIQGGDYIMIAGKPPGKTEGTLYVVDLNTAKMLAITYDQSKKGLFSLAKRDITEDFR